MTREKNARGATKRGMLAAPEGEKSVQRFSYLLPSSHGKIGEEVFQHRRIGLISGVAFFWVSFSFTLPCAWFRIFIAQLLVTQRRLCLCAAGRSA